MIIYFVNMSLFVINIMLNIIRFIELYKDQESYGSFIDNIKSTPLLIYVFINISVFSVQVRAASVYALGTFINSVTTRSEHANNIDQIIAMTLINTVSYDMCPLVRKVRLRLTDLKRRIGKLHT